MPCFSGQVVNNQIIFSCTVEKQGARQSGSGQAVQPATGFRALLDTGAQSSAISQSIVDRLGLSPVGWIDITGVHGTVNTPLHVVDVGIGVQEMAADAHGNLVAISAFAKAFPNMRVSLGNFGSSPTFDILIGMDIISGCHITLHGNVYTICI